MASYHSPHTSKPLSTKVKPILRRLTQSETNSLDLDRSLYEQSTGLGISEHSDGLGNAYNGRSSHDISSSGGTGGGAGRRGYHARSTSNTSQFSTTTTGSGHHRSGSFVHPFAQTPRPYTPPLVGTTSLRASIDTSPALTEDEGVEYGGAVRSPSSAHTHTSFAHPFRSASNLSSHSLATHHEPKDISSPSISHTQAQPLRLQTKTHSSSSSRLALAISHTSLRNTNTNTALSPTDQTQTQTITSPISTPTSTMRTSLDIATSTFRLRSRSEGLDTLTSTTSSSHSAARSRTNSHATIQEARLRFAEREQLKEEKAAREEVKQLEKRQMKEARARERGGRRSSASERPASYKSRRETVSTVLSRERGDVEKDGLVARGYGEVEGAQTPVFVPAGVAEGEENQGPRRSAAKLKTHSAWTKFVMWLRTRFIRMGSKSN